MYLLDLQTMHLDTIWEDEPFAYSAQFSPEGTQLLIHGAPEAFGGIGLNIRPEQTANSYDTQSFIMDLTTRHIEPVTKNFNPAIDSQQWNYKDGFIYYRTQDGDRENMYRYSFKTKKFEMLPLQEDVIRSFDIARNGEWATYTGVSVSNSSRAYLFNLKTMKSTLLCDPYAERLEKLELGDVKDWNFTSSFGDVIEGRYYLPPHFDPAKNIHSSFTTMVVQALRNVRSKALIHCTCMQLKIMLFTRFNRVVLPVTVRNFRHVTLMPGENKQPKKSSKGTKKFGGRAFLCGQHENR